MRANLLWDDPEYTLAMDVKGDREKAIAKNNLFIERIEDEKLFEIPDVAALITFLKNPDKLESLAKIAPESIEELRLASFISFRIAGRQEPIFRNPEIIRRLDTKTSTVDGGRDLCIVSGVQDTIARLHPPIKGVRGANTTGGNIVGFNAAAFCSFGKTQGDNAPVGESASFAYTTALNTLLDKDSNQKIQVGDATVVFWSKRKTIVEDQFLAWFAEPPPDDPDRLVEAVTALYNSVESGTFTQDGDDTGFYVLGLSPNAGRLSVRFWHVGTVADIAANIRQYFEDLRIAHGAKDRKDLSLWRLLVSTAVQGKSENINPNLAGEVMRSILGNLPFPETLLQAVLLRTKAERDVSYPRAKLIKGYINRKLRFNPQNNERMLTMSLDKENPNIGYQLGRLFAVLEKIQQEAQPGINATIRDKFYASASSTPSTVFGNLMRLKNHHLSKLENPGRRIWFEKALGEIVDSITDFPSHLPLGDQGRFAIGYYHQVQDLWTKKSDKQNN